MSTQNDVQEIIGATKSTNEISIKKELFNSPFNSPVNEINSQPSIEAKEKSEGNEQPIRSPENQSGEKEPVASEEVESSGSKELVSSPTEPVKKKSFWKAYQQRHLRQPRYGFSNMGMMSN